MAKIKFSYDLTEEGGYRVKKTNVAVTEGKIHLFLNFFILQQETTEAVPHPSVTKLTPESSKVERTTEGEDKLFLTVKNAPESPSSSYSHQGSSKGPQRKSYQAQHDRLFQARRNSVCRLQRIDFRQLNHKQMQEKNPY